jgi:hypothetical protein
MKWFKKKMIVIEKKPVLDEDKLLEAFSVDPETLLLRGVLAVLAGLEEIAKERTATRGIGDSDRAFYAGGIDHIAEAQERIIELVRQGNEEKRGNRKEGGQRMK